MALRWTLLVWKWAVQPEFTPTVYLLYLAMLFQSVLGLTTDKRLRSDRLWNCGLLHMATTVVHCPPSNRDTDKSNPDTVDFLCVRNICVSDESHQIDFENNESPKRIEHLWTLSNICEKTIPFSKPNGNYKSRCLYELYFFVNLKCRSFKVH